MKNSVKVIFPNTLTLLNLLSGTIGIVFSFQGEFVYASLMIFLGGVFDFFDGFVARALKVNNPIGKDLDSLADIITFGLLPAFILFNYIGRGEVAYASFLIVAMSALRLAKFNNDPDQKKIFKGLPTPGLAIFFAALVLSDKLQGIGFVSNEVLILVLIIVMSVILVVPVRMLSFKFDGDYSWGKNWRKYVFVFLAFALIILFKWLGLAMGIILYIFYSLVLL